MDILLLPPMWETKKQILTAILSSLKMPEAISFCLQILDQKLLLAGLHPLLCKLPEEPSQRMSVLQKIWDLAQKITEDSTKVEAMKQIVCIGIREKESFLPKTKNFLLELWATASRMETDFSFSFLATTFPIFLKFLDKPMAKILWESLKNENREV
jgi:hypothetical protein